MSLNWTLCPWWVANLVFVPILFYDFFFRILQKRTESNLIDHECQLKHHARQLSNAESQLTLTETCRREVCHEISDLKSENNKLSATNACLQKEKDHLIVSATAFAIGSKKKNFLFSLADEIGRENRENLFARNEIGIVA